MVFEGVSHEGKRDHALPTCQVINVQNALPYWAVCFDLSSMSVLHSATMYHPNSAVDNIPKAMTTTNIVWPSDQGSDCGWRVARVGRLVSLSLATLFRGSWNWWLGWRVQTLGGFYQPPVVVRGLGFLIFGNIRAWESMLLALYSKMLRSFFPWWNNCRRFMIAHVLCHVGSFCDSRNSFSAACERSVCWYTPD